MKKAKAFFFNAVLLTATSLLMRTVGVSFGVYLSGKLGAAGLGLYQLIMSIYTFAVTFATSGVNLAATRLVAEELGRGNPGGAKRAMLRCLLYTLCFGTAATLLLLWQADFIGGVLLGDVRCIRPLRVLALSLPFIGMSSALSGYFTAVRRVVKSAAAQVLEQFVRISLTILALTALMPKGLEYACIAIVGGGAVSELCSFLCSFALYLLDRHRHLPGGSRRLFRGTAAYSARLRGADEQEGRGLTARMLGISLPVALSAYARSGLVTIEHLLIPRGLRRSGANPEAALASYGLLHGMVLPILLFPAAFLQALAGLLVPELAECRAQGRMARINAIAARVFQITLLFSIGVSGLMFSFAPDLALAVYGTTDTAPYIRLLAPLIPVMYLDTAVDGMLKGLGEQVSSMRYNIIDASCSVLLVALLVPKFGLAGYVATIFFTELLNSFLSANRLICITNFSIDLFSCVAGPILGIIGASSAAKLLFRMGGFAFSSHQTAAAAQLTLAAAIYGVFLLVSSCVTREDADWAASIFRS